MKWMLYRIFCERMAILDKGEVSLTGNVKEILKINPRN